MSLWRIAWRSIQQRALASTLTAISMALGVALVVAVLVANGVIKQSFETNSGLGYNIIVGAKGGKLQLVLNTVFYLSSPVENIPYSYYKEFVSPQGRFKPYVAKAIPVCLGDYFQSFRVVGTTTAMFDNFEYASGRKYEFADGHNFDAEHFFEAVVGSTVARQAGLKLGDKVQPSHGVPEEQGGHKHEDQFTVVGILAPTGTPNDRAVFVNMEGFYLIEGHERAEEKHEHAVDEHEHEKHVDEKHADEKHDHAHHDHDHEHKPLPEAQREVTAILVRTTNDLYSLGMLKSINKDTVAQALLPIGVIQSFFKETVGYIELVLLGLTILVVVVSGVGILVSIYNSMNDRKHEIAVMRALGAGRATVMLIVLFESILLSLLGGLGGWLLGHGLIAALSGKIYETTGVSLGFFHFVGYESIIIPALAVLASAVGFLPALVAYRTDVAKALTASP